MTWNVPQRGFKHWPFLCSVSCRSHREDPRGRRGGAGQRADGGEISYTSSFILSLQVYCLVPSFHLHKVYYESTKISEDFRRDAADSKGFILYHSGLNFAETSQVGWQLKHLVERLRAESGAVVLTLKKKRATGSGSAAPLKNMRWRPPLVKTTQPSGPASGPRAVPGTAPQLGEESPKRGASILDLYIPLPPAAPYCPLEGGSSPIKAMSPNSCLDADRPFSAADPEAAVRLRQRSSTRCKARPVSMPVDLSSRIYARKGLQRCLSNERVSAILEEEGFPVQYRAAPLNRGLAPSLRGVDHIRGSQCFMNAELHNSATIPYHQHLHPGTRGDTGGEAGQTEPQTGPQTRPRSRSKPSSVIGGWLARLRLLSH
uniref:DUF1170 domain-containing protein n=1 Tax=Neogobius melanostomus TaxID=47308 RepID=A0A8C6S959_9GOBI